MEIFGSQDLLVCTIDLLNDGDSVYSIEKVFGMLGTPVKTCLMCMGTLVKYVGSRNHLSSIASFCGNTLSKDTFKESTLSMETNHKCVSTHCEKIFLKSQLFSRSQALR